MEQRRHRQLALAIDADVDDVLGVEFEVEPRAAIRNDARGEEILARRVGLAAVMVEQDARRTVHLADDDALGAVDDEGAVARHQGHVAHVDVLLLDIDDRLGLGVGIDFEGGEAQRDAHRRGIGQPALAALVGVILGIFEDIFVEVEMRGAGEILDREDRAQGLFEAGDIAVAGSERRNCSYDSRWTSMRFGMFEISWMLPKILRMRREVVERAEGTSFALVAMIFPALGDAPLTSASQDDLLRRDGQGDRMSPGRGPEHKGGALPASPSPSVRTAARSRFVSR